MITLNLANILKICCIWKTTGTFVTGLSSILSHIKLIY